MSATHIKFDAYAGDHIMLYISNEAGEFCAIGKEISLHSDCSVDGSSVPTLFLTTDTGVEWEIKPSGENVSVTAYHGRSYCELEFDSGINDLFKKIIKNARETQGVVKVSNAANFSTSFGFYRRDVVVTGKVRKLKYIGF